MKIEYNLVLHAAIKQVDLPSLATSDEGQHSLSLLLLCFFCAFTIFLLVPAPCRPAHCCDITVQSFLHQQDHLEWVPLLRLHLDVIYFKCLGHAYSFVCKVFTPF